MIGMSLSTRSTLNLEHIPKRVVLSIVRAQVRDPVISELPLTSVKLACVGEKLLVHTLASQL